MGCCGSKSEEGEGVVPERVQLAASSQLAFQRQLCLYSTRTSGSTFDAGINFANKARSGRSDDSINGGSRTVTFFLLGFTLTVKYDISILFISGGTGIYFCPIVLLKSRSKKSLMRFCGDSFEVNIFGRGRLGVGE